MNLDQQLDEIELLQSMYSAPGEFQIEDQLSFEQAQAYCKQICTDPPKSLSFKLSILIDAHQDSDDEEEEQSQVHAMTCTDTQYPLDIAIRLGNSYPAILPEVYVSSKELHRTNQDSLNTDLQHYMSTLTLNEPCVLTIVEWARDNATGYFPIPIPPEPDSEPDQPSSKCFCRMWLYMHHIYSKTKRRNILAYASDLDLSGFCLPGKPGVVCTEGTEQNVKEFYSILRRWNWKSITCRKRELSDSMDIVAHRRIRGFQELVLDIHGHRSMHMDMGQFRDYLKQHKLEYMFKELFGVEGV